MGGAGDRGRPARWSPAIIPTVWCDEQGRGVDDEGYTFRLPHRRALQDLLDLGLTRAPQAGARVRVMLTGSRPSTDWLGRRIPEWHAAGHWVDSSHGYDTQRWTHDESRVRVEIRRTAEWWGEEWGETPLGARRAWAELSRAVDHATRHPRSLLLSPAATGLHTWAWCLPPDTNVPTVDEQTAALLHATSTQHRIELMAGPGDRCACPACVVLPIPDRPARLAVVDARWSYAASARELGVGPGTHMTGGTLDRLTAPGRHARAWVHVRATVPDGWDTLGLLLAPRPSTAGWHAPNRPGARVDTWADMAEVDLAREWGWRVELVEGILWEPGQQPLDLWTARLRSARQEVEGLPTVGPLVAAAIRRIHLHGIGAMASTGRELAYWAPSTWDVPEDATRVIPSSDSDGVVFYRRTHGEVGHPELAIQVWGRARARTLWQPSTATGALAVAAGDLIGVHGDAILATDMPAWARSVAHPGGRDDGHVGRLRSKGQLTHPAPVPVRHRDRDRLVHQAAADAASEQALTASMLGL